MRFIAASCLREGMVLGKTLYGLNNQILLTAGTVLNKIYVNRIVMLKYNGVYVEDDLSKDIPVLDILSDELKQKTVKGIKQIFVESTAEISSGRMPKGKKDLSGTKMLVESIVEDILDNKNLMINMVDLKIFDEYTFYHSVNVTVLSIVLGAAIHLTTEELYKLGLSALLHDIGKVFIPKEILNKPGRLTEKEFEIVKSHSEAGYKYIKEGYDVPLKSYVGILQHHERYDGGGYPDGKKFENISLFGRIISISDVYDALTSDRPYRKGMLPSEAMEYIMGGSGTMFDPKLVKVFVKKIAPYPVGVCVELSNGFKAIVAENYEECCMRPKVKVYEQGDKKINPYEINLADEKYRHITIISIVND